MGFMKPFNKDDINHKIVRAYGEIMSPYNDGFNQFELKKELYEIKWVVDEVLKRTPKFSGEEEWLTEQDKKQMWSELKR